jgi:GH43 family beta-xylosidase
MVRRAERKYFRRSYVAGREPFNLNTQRIPVLESAGLDPMGPYTFKADMLDPTQNNTWELDPSILQLNGRLYLLGTFFNGSQPNFIRPLSNPWTASGTRHILSTATFGWERVGGAVNEGAEVLQRNGQTFIVFSASHCSTPDYKLGILRYNGGDPAQPVLLGEIQPTGLPGLRHQPHHPRPEVHLERGRHPQLRHPGRPRRPPPVPVRRTRRMR